MCSVMCLDRAFDSRRGYTCACLPYTLDMPWHCRMMKQAADAFGGEVLCTFLLVLSVYAATDGELSRKHAHISANLPLAIGLTVLLGALSSTFGNMAVAVEMRMVCYIRCLGTRERRHTFVELSPRACMARSITIERCS